MKLSDIEARAKADLVAYDQQDDRETVAVCEWLREAIRLLAAIGTPGEDGDTVTLLAGNEEAARLIVSFWRRDRDALLAAVGGKP